MNALQGYQDDIGVDLQLTCMDLGNGIEVVEVICRRRGDGGGCI
jgi:hypothetical protein